MMRAKLWSLLGVMFFISACTTTQDNGMSASGDGQAPTPGSVDEFVQTVGDRVFFGYDRYDISPDAQATLRRQAQWLQEYPSVTVRIEGHADERGTREYNLALGERRANAVRNYLVANGVQPGRITVISYGKERPAVVGNNETAWAQNRRAVTVITGGSVSN